MDLLGMVDPDVLTADTLRGLAYGMVKVLAFAALAVVFVGAIMSGLCDLFECRRWEHDHGRTEVWRLMH